jgi:hypothetical protein
MKENLAKTKTTTYDEQYAKNLPDLFSQGETLDEVLVHMEIDKETFFTWAKQYPEFAAAYQKGLQIAKAWWLRLGRAGAMGKVAVNQSLWSEIMKQRFNWMK